MIYLITYKGQRDSPYIYSFFSQTEAEEMYEFLVREYPDREWSLEEKDVS